MATEIESPMKNLALQERSSNRLKLESLRRSSLKAKNALGSVMDLLRPSPRVSSDNETSPECESSVRIQVDALPSKAALPGNAGLESRQLSLLTLASCLKLLECSDLEDNRKGLQLLLLLTKAKAKFASPKANALDGIVYDGDANTGSSRLQELLLSFLCDDIEMPREPMSIADDASGSDDESDFDDTSESDDGEEFPRGHHWGALHCTALRVIVNCLEQILTIQQKDSKPINFSCVFWRNVTITLSHNLEMGHCADISGYSLRCLRLLQTIEPDAVTPFLQYNLLPFLVSLKEYGDLHNYPMIQGEASRLLKATT
jgi:hypothetical protein